MEIYSKCTCGEEWSTSISDILLFSEYERLLVELFVKHKKNFQVKKNILEFLTIVRINFPISEIFDMRLASKDEIEAVMHGNTNGIVRR